MFTNNYIKYHRYMFMYNPNNGSPESDTLVGVTGGTIKMQAANCGYAGFGGALKFGRVQSIPTGSAAAHATGYGVYFGTGSTPATKEDYKLENPITSGMTITNPSAISLSQDGEGRYVAEAVYTLTNTSGETMNIYEVGVFVSIGIVTSGQFYPILAERTVLSEPVTIPAGSSKLVSYKVILNQTLNVEA